MLVLKNVRVSILSTDSLTFRFYFSRRPITTITTMGSFSSKVKNKYLTQSASGGGNQHQSSDQLGAKQEPQPPGAKQEPQPSRANQEPQPPGANHCQPSGAANSEYGTNSAAPSSSAPTSATSQPCAWCAESLDLHYSADLCHWRCVETLIPQVPHHVNKIDPEGYTVLMKALNGHGTRAVRALLARSDVNDLDVRFPTQTQPVVAKNMRLQSQLSVPSLPAALPQTYANFKRVMLTDCRKLFKAVLNRQLWIANKPNRNRLVKTLVLKCSWCRCLDAFVRAGADVNPRDKPSCEKLAVATAVAKNLLECTELLLASGAAVNRVKLSGKSSTMYRSYMFLMHMAASRGFDRCLQLILRSGNHISADIVWPPLSDPWLYFALNSAEYNGHPACVKTLLAAGAGKWDRWRCFLFPFWRYGPRFCFPPKQYDPEGQEACAVLLASGPHPAVLLDHALAFEERHMVRAYCKTPRALTDRDGARFGAVDHMKRGTFLGPETALLLYADGEFTEGTTKAKMDVRHREWTVRGPGSSSGEVKKFSLWERNGSRTFLDFLGLGEVKLRLKHLCREAIRRHLIELEPTAHLFRRIPLLGLPPSVTDYLLFHQTLLDEPAVAPSEQQESCMDETLKMLQDSIEIAPCGRS